MDRYELSAEDIEALRWALYQAQQTCPVATVRQTNRDLLERIDKAHVVYIETEDTQL